MDSKSNQKKQDPASKAQPARNSMTKDEDSFRAANSTTFGNQSRDGYLPENRQPQGSDEDQLQRSGSGQRKDEDRDQGRGDGSGSAGRANDPPDQFADEEFDQAFGNYISGKEDNALPGFRSSNVDSEAEQDKYERMEQMAAKDDSVTDQNSIGEKSEGDEDRENRFNNGQEDILDGDQRVQVAERPGENKSKAYEEFTGLQDDPQPNDRAGGGQRKEVKDDISDDWTNTN